MGWVEEISSLTLGLERSGIIVGHEDPAFVVCPDDQQGRSHCLVVG